MVAWRALRSLLCRFNNLASSCTAFFAQVAESLLLRLSRLFFRENSLVAYLIAGNLDIWLLSLLAKPGQCCAIRIAGRPLSALTSHLSPHCVYVSLITHLIGRPGYGRELTQFLIRRFFTTQLDRGEISSQRRQNPARTLLMNVSMVALVCAALIMVRREVLRR